MVTKLLDSEVQIRLKDLPHWSLVNGKLRRKFQFSNFVETFGFMTCAALEIEKMNHHPEWQNTYNRLTVDLVTHSCRGISELDFQLAAKLDQLTKNFALASK